MRVGIDISVLPLGGGVAEYIRNLLENLPKLCSEHSYKLFLNSRHKFKLNMDQDDFHVIKTKIPVRLLEFLWLRKSFPPIEWFIGPVDLFHSPSHSPIYSLCPPSRKWIVTVHDLFTLKLNYKESSQQKEMISLQRMERKASRVIAVSQSTRNDLLELAPSLEPRVTVIYEGVDERFFQAEDLPEIQAQYGIRSPYILYLGAADFHKNLPRLLRVFKRLSRNIPHTLVLAGKLTERYRTIVELAHDLGIQKLTCFTGFIKDGDLPALYKGADLFVLPSLYEGFGLVLLEAMAAGTPVAASNVSSIPEIVDDCALLFSPYDEEEMQDVIHQIITNSSLSNQLVMKGKNRARSFSWRKMTEKTLRVYETVGIL